MKYTDVEVTFREFPDEISLCINISGCKFKCSDCHSKELWEDIGTKLSFKELHRLITHNKGITLVGFMGGIPKDVNELAEYVKNINPPLKVGWYWGGETFPLGFNLANFDYIKIGPYIKKRGALDNPNTNQKMYKISEIKETGTFNIEDITFKFRK